MVFATQIAVINGRIAELENQIEIGLQAIMKVEKNELFLIPPNTFLEDMPPQYYDKEDLEELKDKWSEAYSLILYPQLEKMESMEQDGSWGKLTKEEKLSYPQSFLDLDKQVEVYVGKLVAVMKGVWRKEKQIDEQVQQRQYLLAHQGENGFGKGTEGHKNGNVRGN